MERWLNKLVALLVIMVVMLVVVFVPFKIMRCFTNLGRRGQVILARLNCFTGGIFLGTCLLFLLPEVSLLLSPKKHPIHYPTHHPTTPTHHPTTPSHHPTTPTHHSPSTHPPITTISTPIHYPYPQVVIMIGFLFIMYIERMVHACRQKGRKQHVRSLSVVAVANGDCNSTPLRGGDDDDGGDGGDGGGDYINPYTDVKKSLQKVSDESNNMRMIVRDHQAQNDNQLREQVSVEIEDQVQERRLRRRGESEGERRLRGRGESETAEMEGISEENTTKAVILFIALAMDEILGGLSMGLQRSNAGVWGMVVGLLAHEAVVGFSFGLQLASLASSKKCLSYTLGTLYALMTPLGAALGLIIYEVTVIEHIDIVNGVLQGLATGVFLYVTFFEILEGEIHSQTPLANIACFTLGCGVMAAIASLPREEYHNVHHLLAINASDINSLHNALEYTNEF